MPKEMETLPYGEVEKVQLTKLQAQLRYLLAHSPFYQEKLTAAGIKPEQIRSLSDLASIPFTVKNEIRTSLAAESPLGRHRAAPMDKVIFRQASSGTTGKPTWVGLTTHDLDLVMEMQARCFDAAGFAAGGSAVHAMALSRGFAGGVPMATAVMRLGVQLLPLGAEAGIERLLMAIESQKPDYLIAAPSFAKFLGESAPQVLGKPASALSIRRMIAGSEPGAGIPSFRQQLESLWGASVHEMYGLSDLGVGYFAECDCQTGMHFTGQEYLLPEIVNPTTDQLLPFEEGVEGELILSAIDREASPLLRFRTGDHIRVTAAGRCRCRRTGPQIRVLSRLDDMLVVRGINLYPAAVKDVACTLIPQTTGYIQIVADFEGFSTTSALHVKVEQGEQVESAGLPQLQGLLEEKFRSLLGISAKVELVPPLSLGRPGQFKEQLVLRTGAQVK